MKAYSRYIFGQILTGILFIAFCMTCAVWLTQSLRYIELIVKHGISFGTFLYLTALLLPSFLVIVLPVALFGAILFTYNKLWMDRELVILRAVGVSPEALALPALALSVLVMLAGYALNLYLLPTSYRAFSHLMFSISNEFSAVMLQEGKFNVMSDKLTIYVRERQPDGILVGLIIYDTRDKDKPITLIAESGALFQASDGERAVLTNGSRQQIDRDGKLSILYFDKYTADFNLAKAVEATWPRPEERYLGDLLHPNPNDPNDRNNFDRLIAEGHQRLVTPFYAIVYTLIALSALLSGDFNRQGQAKRVLAAVFCVLVLEASSIGFLNMAGKTAALLPLVYLNCLVPLVLAFLYLVRPPRKRTPRFPESGDDLAEQGSAAP
ncbi:MAG TPA: LPS export ABC transporter permease LptF [Alphaproteobacteria bacterium]|nr:LPS export ABC transporter permease LptF [Alphaproteobacteria bacterium]